MAQRRSSFVEGDEGSYWPKWYDVVCTYEITKNDVAHLRFMFDNRADLVVHFLLLKSSTNQPFTGVLHTPVH